MQIQSDRLRELRLQKNLTIQQLAELSKISDRQLSRLEKNQEAASTARERTIFKIAKALDVKPAVLTSDQPIPADTAKPKETNSNRIQVGAQLLPEIHLAYSLIKRKYGVTPTTLFNAAPLLFVLLAENSLRWRKDKLNRIHEHIEQLQRSSTKNGHLSFVQAVWRIEEGASEEEESIRARDIFGRNIDGEAIELGFNRSTNNPFADYLRDLAESIEDPAIIEIEKAELGYAALRDFPEFEIFSTELQGIAGGSAKAMHALRRGYARVSEIPDEFWSDDATERRVNWIESQLPESEHGFFEELMTVFDIADKDGGDISS